MPNSNLIKNILAKKLPQHIAIIMDGNGRWAKAKRLPRIAGHKKGVTVVDKIVTQCRELKIPALTLYSFSKENWLRPKLEIKGLMGILKKYLKKELNRMLKEDIRFNIIGDTEGMPATVKNLLKDTIEKTKDNKGMVLTLALGYGSRGEILNAVKQISNDVKNGTLNSKDINDKLFNSYLYTHNLPEPDLLIRTSGELRISNFLLWQIAYTELYFCNTLWPDFTEKDLILAITDFQNRNRRFGKV